MQADERLDGAEMAASDMAASDRRPLAASLAAALAPDTLPAADQPRPTLEPRHRDALNPLLSIAAPVLALAAGLRDGATSAGSARAAAAEALERFDAEAAGLEETAPAPATLAPIDPADLRAARIALAATLDDVARAAGHGGASVGEPGADVRFFDLLDGMLGDPRRHRHALELYYACLSLGFEGRFRDRPGGAHDLAHLRDELYRILRRARGEVAAELSPAWAGAGGRFRPLGGTLPAWIVWAAVALGLSGLYVHLAGTLDRQAEPVAARIAALLPDRPIEIARLVPPPPPTAGPALIARVTGRLAPEIRTGAVEVLAGEDGALVIRIPAAAMFATGADAVKARHRAIVERVGQTLAAEPGSVVVVAHTDDQTPPSGRLPTAQALTEARAEAVRRLLERSVAPARLTAEGRGDQEPVALNDAPAGRDSNRRVDIRLYPQ
ncbi:type IVB secretion system protein IcmH/DotU [Azospirillum sp. HJ39]|uniref:type IVB secretion system protein IcmH/DotU n=1 Tax=Azospirillum sp. HJ39 TaxID=3159496 RepID=UPI0035561303